MAYTLTVNIGKSTNTAVLCWEIIRSDTLAIRLTQHDQALVINDKIYYPVDSVTPSASSTNAGLDVRDRDVKGVLSSDLITENDLLKGLYRDALVREFTTLWDEPDSGELLVSVYWIRSIKFDGETWNATMEGLSSWTKTEIGANYTLNCRHVFGDEQCGYDVSQGEVTATVVTPTNRATFVVNVTGDDGKFTQGRFTWESGLNTGVVCEIKEWYVDGTVELWLDTPYDIAIGDTGKMQVGCNLQFVTCRDRFDNQDNFGGFPDIPGNDKYLSTPDSV